MKLITIIISMLLVSPVYAVEKYPKLSFIDKRIVDVKKVKQGTVVKQVFNVKNIGDAPLVFLSVDKSCNCTSAKISKNILQPNETGRVEIEIDTKGKVGATTISVVLETNTLEKEHALRISMDVVK